MQPVAGVLWKSSLLSGSTLWTVTTVNKPVIGELGWATKRFSSHIWLQRMPLLKRQWSFYLLLCPWLHPQVWVQWMNQWIVFLGNNIWGGLHVRAQRQPLMTETAILNLVPRHPLIIPWPWYLGFQDSMRPPILPLCVRPGWTWLEQRCFWDLSMDTLYNYEVISKIQCSIADLFLALWDWPYKKCQTKWAQWPMPAAVTPGNFPYEIAVAIHISPK